MGECIQLKPDKNNEFLMTDIENEGNIKAFSKLMPQFFYSTPSTEKIISKINGKNLNEDDLFINNLFNMNTQGRTWFSVNTINEYTDEAYAVYKNLLFSNADRNSGTHAIYNNLNSNYNIAHYDVYKSGKVRVGKQIVKLFKLLLNKGLLSKEDMDKINSTRTTDKTAYMCISKNPIDYLVSSTGQSFTSCESLNSNYRSAYYLGLPGLVLDTNRVIIFLTNGTQSDLNIRDTKLTHFNFTCRSWAILNIEDLLYIIRYYPSKVVDFAQLLSQTGYKVLNIDGVSSDKYKKSKFKFELPTLQNSTPISIYFDNFGPIKDVEQDDELYYYNKDGLTGGSVHTTFNWTFGFEKIEEFDMLYKECILCFSCQKIIPKDASKTITSPQDGTQAICLGCFDKKYTECSECGQSYDKQEQTKKYKVCDTCITTILHECYDCGALRHIEEVCYIPKLGKFICKYCIEGE